MPSFIAKIMTKVFALDGRSSVVEYGVITAVLLTALLSALLAMGDSIGMAFQVVAGDPPKF